MNTNMDERTRIALVEVFNGSLAGWLASDAMGEALQKSWLPAMASLIDREPHSEAEVHRVLVRLGWLLKHLPEARSIHAGLLGRAIREYRTDWKAIAPEFFPDGIVCAQETEILDSELLDSLHVTGDAIEYAPFVERKPLNPLSGVGRFMHPYDRGAPLAWQSVLTSSRIRRRDDDAAVDALTRVAGLRAGDRVLMMLSSGRRETWRVVRNEESRKHLLLESEETSRQGVLGLQAMASQLAEGRIAILTC